MNADGTGRKANGASRSVKSDCEEASSAARVRSNSRSADTNGGVSISNESAPEVYLVGNFVMEAYKRMSDIPIACSTSDAPNASSPGIDGSATASGNYDHDTNHAAATAAASSRAQGKDLLRGVCRICLNANVRAFARGHVPSGNAFTPTSGSAPGPSPGAASGPGPGPGSGSGSGSASSTVSAGATGNGAASSSSSSALLLHCVLCERSYHPHCIIPPLSQQPLQMQQSESLCNARSDSWICAHCKGRAQAFAHRRATAVATLRAVEKHVLSTPSLPPRLRLKVVGANAQRSKVKSEKPPRKRARVKDVTERTQREQLGNVDNTLRVARSVAKAGMGRDGCKDVCEELQVVTNKLEHQDRVEVRLQNPRNARVGLVVGKNVVVERYCQQKMIVKNRTKHRGQFARDQELRQLEQGIVAEREHASPMWYANANFANASAPMTNTAAVNNAPAVTTSAQGLDCVEGRVVRRARGQFADVNGTASAKTSTHTPITVAQTEQNAQQQQSGRTGNADAQAVSSARDDAQQETQQRQQLAPRVEDAARPASAQRRDVQQQQETRTAPR